MEYSLFEHHHAELTTATGLAFDEITLDAVLEGRLGMDDLRVAAGALEAQAGIAERAGRPQLADNLRRAAELVAVPEEEILAIYNALRPGRATPEVLLRIASDLEARHRAPRCAHLLREAAAAYRGAQR
jgi:propanediol dehydratase small subunit